MSAKSGSEHYLATGPIVVIGAALSFACVFLLTAFGIFIERQRIRRNDGGPMQLDKRNGLLRRLPFTINETDVSNEGPETLLERQQECQNASRIKPIQPARGNSTVASSSARISIRSFASFYSDSSSWASSSGQSPNRMLSHSSGGSSRPSWLELMSCSSTFDVPEWGVGRARSECSPPSYIWLAGRSDSGHTDEQPAISGSRGRGTTNG